MRQKGPWKFHYELPVILKDGKKEKQDKPDKGRMRIRA
jgi:hypothetical protein